MRTHVRRAFPGFIISIVAHRHKRTVVERPVECAVGRDLSVNLPRKSSMGSYPDTDTWIWERAVVRVDAGAVAGVCFGVVGAGKGKGGAHEIMSRNGRYATPTSPR